MKQKIVDPSVIWFLPLHQSWRDFKVAAIVRQSVSERVEDINELSSLAYKIYLN